MRSLDATKACEAGLVKELQVARKELVITVRRPRVERGPTELSPIRLVHELDRSATQIARATTFDRSSFWMICAKRKDLLLKMSLRYASE